MYPMVSSLSSSVLGLLPWVLRMILKRASMVAACSGVMGVDRYAVHARLIFCSMVAELP